MGTSRDQYMRGTRFICDQDRSGASSGMPGNADQCAEAKINVDWVLFRDASARARYFSARRRGFSVIDALINAQGHNPHAQSTIRNCAQGMTAYLAGLAESAKQADAELSNRKITDEDCKCISVIPVNEDAQGRLIYRVTNNCADGFEVSVKFRDQSLRLADASSWGSLGLIGFGQAKTVQPPATYRLTSIAAVGLHNVSSSYTCNFDFPKY